MYTILSSIKLYFVYCVFVNVFPLVRKYLSSPFLESLSRDLKVNFTLYLCDLWSKPLNLTKAFRNNCVK